MNDNLPVRLNLAPSRELTRAAVARERTELAVYEHHLQARFLAECDQIDTQALGDVMRTALDEELGLLDWGMERAACSAAKAELVGRKVSLQAQLNNARIMRRYGR